MVRMMSLEIQPIFLSSPSRKFGRGSRREARGAERKPGQGGKEEDGRVRGPCVACRFLLVVVESSSFTSTLTLAMAPDSYFDYYAQCSHQVGTST